MLLMFHQLCLKDNFRLQIVILSLGDINIYFTYINYQLKTTLFRAVYKIRNTDIRRKDIFPQEYVNRGDIL